MNESAALYFDFFCLVPYIFKLISRWTKLNLIYLQELDLCAYLYVS